MKKSLFILFFSFLAMMIASAQTTWINKEVGNGLFVKFPFEPTYKLQEKSGIYTTKTANCIFEVIISYDVIPRYPEFIKLSPQNQNKIGDLFLDGVIKGKLKYTNNPDISATTYKIGKYFGREISYDAINPLTGEQGKRFSKIILINNKLYSFECWYLSNSELSENERNLFFKSIILNFN